MSGLARMLAAMVRDNGLWTLPALGPALARRLRSRLAAWCFGAPGLILGPGCELLGVRHVRWGRDVSVRSRLWLEAVTAYAGQRFTPVIRIGDRVAFSDDVHISAIERIEIGQGVLFGSRVFVSDHNHGRYGGEAQSAPRQPPTERPLTLRGPVVIEDNVWIADGVNIVGPARIGYGAILGANAVVRGDVPPHCMVAGSPARVVKQFDAASGRWERAVTADRGG